MFGWLVVPCSFCFWCPIFLAPLELFHKEGAPPMPRAKDSTWHMVGPQLSAWWSFS